VRDTTWKMIDAMLNCGSLPEDQGGLAADGQPRRQTALDVGQAACAGLVPGRGVRLQDQHPDVARRISLRLGPEVLDEYENGYEEPEDDDAGYLDPFGASGPTDFVEACRESAAFLAPWEPNSPCNRAHPLRQLRHIRELYGVHRDDLYASAVVYRLYVPWDVVVEAGLEAVYGSNRPQADDPAAPNDEQDDAHAPANSDLRYVIATDVAHNSGSRGRGRARGERSTPGASDRDETERTGQLDKGHGNDDDDDANDEDGDEDASRGNSAAAQRPSFLRSLFAYAFGGRTDSGAKSSPGDYYGADAYGDGDDDGGSN
jgi:hypothetical protein